MKIVINTAIGGFTLSEEAIAELGDPWTPLIRLGVGTLDRAGDIRDGLEHLRSHPDLIAAVEKLGPAAAACPSITSLKVVEIPDSTEWVLECDMRGVEWVAEKHKTWP